VIDFFGSDAWVDRRSPTDGVLIYAFEGSVPGLYDGLAGQTWVE
jgi:hypothetical protein